MVFQSYALYPHMTVYENIAFSLKLKKFPKEEIDRKVRKVAEDANQMPAEIIDLRKRIDTTLFT